MPLPGGLGKPLKLITHPLRADIPVYLGAEGPKNVALAAEIGLGWLPLFVFPEKIEAMYGEALSGAGPDFDIAAMVMVLVTDDLRAAKPFGGLTGMPVPCRAASPLPGWAACQLLRRRTGCPPLLTDGWSVSPLVR